MFQGVFIICYSHTEDDLFYFCKAFEEVVEVYKLALKEGYEKYLIGDKAMAVFRKIL